MSRLEANSCLAKAGLAKRGKVPDEECRNLAETSRSIIAPRIPRFWRIDANHRGIASFRGNDFHFGPGNRPTIFGDLDHPLTVLHNFLMQ